MNDLVVILLIVGTIIVVALTYVLMALYLRYLNNKNDKDKRN